MRIKTLLSIFLITTVMLILMNRIDIWTIENAPPIIVEQPSLPNIVDDVINSVVHIRNNSRYVHGSGVAIAPDVIVTAWHLVKNSDDFTITTNDGNEIKASIAISSKKYDIGFIKLDESVLKPARFGSIDECRLGQSVFAIGSPYGKENFNTVTMGVISGLDRNLGEFNGWQVCFSTDSAGHPGNSGCPVFSFDGVVRGILVAGRSPVLVYCIPVDVFITDGAAIRMMFVQNEYYIEQKPVFKYED